MMKCNYCGMTKDYALTTIKGEDKSIVFCPNHLVGKADDIITIKPLKHRCDCCHSTNSYEVTNHFATYHLCYNHLIDFICYNLSPKSFFKLYKEDELGRCDFMLHDDFYWYEDGYKLQPNDEWAKELKILNKFEMLKKTIMEKGVKYPRGYHTWYDLDKKDTRMSYTTNQYPQYEEIIDYKKNVVYKKRKGVVEKSQYNGYETTYILIIDGHFIKEANHPQDLWQYVSANYQLSIDYYGYMSPSEIVKREYTDSHEGNEFFIADVTNVETKRSINIQVQDVLYIDDYLDEENMGRGFQEYIQYCEQNKE